MAFFDAHLHLLEALSASGNSLHSLPEDVFGATCTHSAEEYEKEKLLVEKINSENGLKYIRLFGIHPQNPLEENIPFLEDLLSRGEIHGIGEIGYDLYAPQFKLTLERQEKVFLHCLELAAKHGVSVVIHDRKAFDQLVSHAGLLKKVPCCVFHGFAFSAREAEILLKKCVNGYFSFGKSIMNGNKKSIQCCRELPLERILLETDAPFMTMKGESFTPVEHIRQVYQAFAFIRGFDGIHGEQELASVIKRNFSEAFQTNVSSR